MKKLSILTAVLVLTSFSSHARAKIPVCFPCEYIETTMELPAEAAEDLGEALNIGYKYNQINILWVPIWNKDGEYCLVNEAEDTYYELSEEQKTYLTETYDASFEGSPLGLWDKLGGKVIIAIILFIILYGYLPGRKKDDESESDAAA
ncbi:MAG: hypothetical protein AB8B72_01210 [Crocinitomicaceae bacterium]